jgi:hypothetical protein
MQIALQEWDFDPVGVETVPNRHKNSGLNIIDSMKNYLKILKLLFQLFYFLFCHFTSRLSDIRVIREQLHVMPSKGLLLRTQDPNLRLTTGPAIYRGRLQNGATQFLVCSGTPPPVSNA